MKRSELEHLLRAAADLTGDSDIFVIGSQSILGWFPEDDLPVEATRSDEADLGFFIDPDEKKSDAVHGTFGIDSDFHRLNGYYGDGVSLTTAKLPDGWRGRAMIMSTGGTRGARGWCAEPHDVAISKIYVGRQKDLEFADALLKAGKISAALLLQRLEATPGIDAARRNRMKTWIESRPPR